MGQPLGGHTDAIFDVIIHEGKIISGSSDSTVWVWDLRQANIGKYLYKGGMVP